MTAQQQAEAFTAALHELVSKQVAETGLCPQPAAAVLAVAAQQALEYLQWMPMETQRAHHHLKKAAKCLAAFYSEPFVATACIRIELDATSPTP